MAPSPRLQPADPRPISPEEPKVAGFVFNVQANIDPQHRDRIAFVRIASGRFQRGMKLKNIRTGPVMSVQAPVFFLARERNLAEEAWPGDIIGIPNHESLRIGDTLTESEPIRITVLPSFAPEILQRVRVEDPMKTKHLAVYAQLRTRTRGQVQAGVVADCSARSTYLAAPRRD